MVCGLLVEGRGFWAWGFGCCCCTVAAAAAAAAAAAVVVFYSKRFSHYIFILVAQV